MKLLYVAGNDPHHLRIKSAELIAKGFGVIMQWDLGNHDEMFIMLLTATPTFWRDRLSELEAELVKRCDAVYFCSDWKSNAKAKVAMNLARQHSKQTFFEGFAEPL